MTTPLPSIFDCNVFVKAMLREHSAAGACWQSAIDGAAHLFVAPFILDELRELPYQKGLRRFSRISFDGVERLIRQLKAVATLADDPPRHFEYPRDPDDARYVDLAIATGAMLVVSGDNDLTDLMDPGDSAGAGLRSSYPEFRVVTPKEFLGLIRPSM